MDIISDGEGEEQAAPVEPKPPKRRRCTNNIGFGIGTLFLVLILCDDSGYWRSIHCQDPVDIGNQYIVGLGLTHWSLIEPPRVPQPFEFLVNAELLRSRAQKCFGYAAYPVVQIAKLVEPVFLPPDTLPRDRITLVAHHLAIGFDFITSSFNQHARQLHAWVELWQTQHGIRRAPKTLTLTLHRNMIAKLFTGSGLFHIVGFTSRLCRKRLIGSKEPSFKLLKAWHKVRVDSDSVAARPRCKTRRLPRHRTGWSNAHEVHMILEWLAASDNIKNTRRIWGTAQKFAKVFAVANSVTVTSVLGILRPANMQVLRSARIRLDVVACNLFRKVWSELVPDTINIYLYLDSSPQVRGEELFALSIELRDPAGNYPWERRLAPMIAIQKDYFDAVGKSLALVYLIWLLVGPTASQVIRFCDRVRGIVTDMGTERKIARSPCLISDYFDLMLDAPVQIPFRLYLFPLAVSSPGWMHGWDVVMQRSLASLSFFPAFLVGTKALIALFRSKLWKSQLLEI